MASAPDPFHVPENVFCAGRRKEVLAMPAPHAHSQVELNFLLSGGMRYGFQGRDIRITAGDFVFFWGAIPHQALAADPATTFICIYVPIAMFLAMPLSARLAGAVLGGAMIAADPPQCFDREQLQRLHRELLGPDTRMVELDRTELEIMLRRVDLTGWRDLADRAPPPSRGGERVHERVCAMVRFMVAHAAEPIGAEAVARAAGLHPNYAMTVFRQALGCSIGAYLTRHRLYLAQQKLAAGRAGITDIAFDCGFGSVSRFYEAFGRQFGVSPHRFRQAAWQRSARAERIDPLLAGPAV
jgi:AraC-like DNA-binding protein